MLALCTLMTHCTAAPIFIKSYFLIVKVHSGYFLLNSDYLKQLHFVIQIVSK